MWATLMLAAGLWAAECSNIQIAVDKKGAKPLMINYRKMGQTTASGPCPILMVHGVLDHR
jgi:hypothetical protein